MDFIIFFSIVVATRIGELIVARCNENWIRKQGALEYGQKHYPFMVLLHSLFFVSLLLEYHYSAFAAWDISFALAYFVLALLKIWVIASLGKYWNTKILRLHKVSLVAKGPYRFIKHPNYVIVVAEIIAIPLAFHLYVTAILFSILNAIMLYVRIKEENRVLSLEEA